MVETAVTSAENIAVATDAFRQAGFAEARGEAVRLWRAIAGDSHLPRATVEPELLAAFAAAAARRAAGEPFAYVTGDTGFRHLTLGCDSRALIPRPESEGLIDVALACGSVGTAIDVGTGTGALALSLRREGRFDQVIGIDISDLALQLARENGRRCGLGTDWVRTDMLDGVGTASADLIVANPPYLRRDEHAVLDRSVRDYEPALALISGEDGLEHSRRLLQHARRVLRPNGWLVVEVDCRRASTTASIAGEFGWHGVSVRDDLFGRARYLLARQGPNDD